MPSPVVIFHWLFGEKAQIHLHCQKKKQTTKEQVLSMKPYCGGFCLFHQVFFGRF